MIRPSGDKVWPLRKRDQDQLHWPGPQADVLDECSMRTVTPYDTAAVTGEGYNANFWAFTPANPKKAYLNVFSFGLP